MSSDKKVPTLKVSLEKEQFSSLIDVLHNLVKAIVSAQVKREEASDRNAHFLRAFGLSETEIGEILGMTQQAVNQALKKKKTPQRKTRGRKAGKIAIAAVKKT